MNFALEAFIRNCTDVLNANSIDGYTVPSGSLYPHQWLWDSCFTAIGLRHIDIERAKKELQSLKRGKWTNGMIPNIIFHESFTNIDYTLWNSKLRPEAPRGINTSCITQPPMLAEAVLQIGRLMPKQERMKWYRSMFDTLLNYHKWLYTERNPDGDGLIIVLHPYESGMDNSPPWMYALGKMRYPWWIKALNRRNIKIIFNHFRRDTVYVPTSQRIGLKDSLQCLYAIRKLTKKHYKYVPGDKNQVVLQDLTFNSILIRANKCLASIAEEIGHELPAKLLVAMGRTEQSLEKLWSPEHKQYFSRNYLTKRLIKQTTIASFMPLYAGCISKSRAETIVRPLKKTHEYKAPFPIPSISMDSKKFSHNKYWQGPTWINTNWLIIRGLQNYGFHELAKEIRDSSIKLVAKNGFHEYFSPIDGKGKGVSNFSWTAALIIDLLKT